MLLLHGILPLLNARQTKEPSPRGIGCHQFLTFFDMFYRKYMAIVDGQD